MKSWSNANNTPDAYIRWIEYTQLTNVQEEALLHHECTHIANWLELSTNELIQVVLKKIVDGHDAQIFDFYQVNNILLGLIEHVLIDNFVILTISIF
jgi:hypothetical protein